MKVFLKQLARLEKLRQSALFGLFFLAFFAMFWLTPSVSLGATFTSVQSGDWNDPTTWGGAAGSPVCHTNVPCMTDSGGAGDLVILGNLAHTITCPAGETCSAGNSPTNDTTSVAIGAANAARTDVQLNVAGTLIYASSVRMPASTWTMQAGAVIKYDSSWSSTATTSKYTWDVPNNARMVYAGTSTSTVTWIGANNSASNSACNSNACRSGRVGSSAATSNTDKGASTCSYTNFSYLGDTVSSDFREGFMVNIFNQNSTFDHCNFDRSNMIYFREAGTNGTGTLDFTGGSITNSVVNNTSYGSMKISTFPSSAAAGSRIIRNTYIEGYMTFGQTSTGVLGSSFNLRSLFFRRGLSGNMGISGGQGVNNSTVNTDQIMVYNDSTTDTLSGGTGGTHTKWHISRYVDGSGNQHPFYPGSGAGATYDGLVAEQNQVGNNSDFLNPPGTGQSGSYFTVKNSIYTCSGDGLSGGAFINNQNGATSTIKFIYENNTICATYTGSAPGNPETDSGVMGMGWECGSGCPNIVAGAYERVVSNIGYRMDGVGTVELVASPTLSPAPPLEIITLVGYNAIYNASSGLANYNKIVRDNSPTAFGVPLNDQVFQRAPSFNDENRRLLNFDTDYLGYSVSTTTWTSGQTYNAGDIVADRQSAIYSNAWINWRAKTSCVASSTNRPYSGTSWVTCWEPAALSYIKTSILAGETFTDSTINASGVSEIGLLNLWIRDGHKPVGADATLLATAGYNGTYVGAMQPDSDSTAPTVGLTAPAAAAYLTGASVTLTATSTDSVGVAGVKFYYDSTNQIGSEITATSSPDTYSSSWDTTAVADGAHTLIAVSRDAAGNTATSSAVSVTVDNTAPTVGITAPSASATISGALVTLTATSTDSVGVAGVKFYYDSTNQIGSEITATSSPDTYSSSWDTTAVADGAHTLIAVSRDAAGNIATSSSVSVTIDNTVPVISSISSGSPSASGATVTWSTDESSDSQVEYGLTSAYTASTTLDSTLVTSHSVAVSGLTAATTYHFRVISSDTQGNRATSTDQTFTTAASSGGGSPPSTSGGGGSIYTQVYQITTTNVTATSAVVSWKTDFAIQGAVQYGTTTTYGLSKDDAGAQTDHAITLTGLLPATAYHFRVKNGFYTYSGDYMFQTPAAANTTTPPAASPTPPATLPTGPGTQPAAPGGTSPSVKLIDDNGTVYLVTNGIRQGITSLGILSSYGFDLDDIKPATAQDLSLPAGSLLLPGNGSLVKSKQDPTVYLISNGQRHAFTSGQNFLALGFKFTSILLVTDPELQALPLAAALINDSQIAHLDGTDVIANGTVYFIYQQTLRPYPSLEVYNSWHKDGDFSQVVPANSEDLKLPVGPMAEARVIE